MQILAAVAGRKSLPYEESTPRYSRLFVWLYISTNMYLSQEGMVACVLHSVFVMLHKERSYESIPCKSKCYYFLVLLNGQN